MRQSDATVAVGVTGHRSLADVETIRDGVRQALDRIERISDGRPLTVVSSLAEGADRIVAEEALKRPLARLIVPLPRDVSDYLEDFESDDSKREFLQLLDRASTVASVGARGPDQAYAAAGGYVLDHSDVLIAVWDGEEAGGPGGTGEIVAEARARGLAMAWIHAETRGKHSAVPGRKAGTVTYERLE